MYAPSTFGRGFVNGRQDCLAAFLTGNRRGVAVQPTPAPFRVFAAPALRFGSHNGCFYFFLVCLGRPAIVPPCEHLSTHSASVRPAHACKCQYGISGTPRDADVLAKQIAAAVKRCPQEMTTDEEV